MSAHLNYRWQDDFFASAPTGPAVPNRELYQIDAHDTLDARLMWSFDMSEGSTGARVGVGNEHPRRRDAAAHHRPGRDHPARGTRTGYPDVPAGFTHSVFSWRAEPMYGVDLVFEF